MFSLLLGDCAPNWKCCPKTRGCEGNNMGEVFTNVVGECFFFVQLKVWSSLAKLLKARWARWKDKRVWNWIAGRRLFSSKLIKKFTENKSGGGYVIHIHYSYWPIVGKEKSLKLGQCVIRNTKTALKAAKWEFPQVSHNKRM